MARPTVGTVFSTGDGQRRTTITLETQSSQGNQQKRGPTIRFVAVKMATVAATGRTNHPLPMVFSSCMIVVSQMLLS
jgi:hypothetical protein